MKKKIIAIVFVVLLLSACLTFVSCGKKYSGTYVNGGFTLTFDGSSVTMKNAHYESTAKYTVKKDGNDRKIYFTFPDGAYDFDLWDSYVIVEEEDGSLTIGGENFKKQ